MSDSHKNVANVRKIIEKHEQDADLFLHLGDGERDFEDVMALYPALRCDHVCGNCDFYSFANTYNLLKTESKRVFYTHGHLYNVKFSLNELVYAAQGLSANIVLYGHTHIAKSEYINEMYVVNPGSCSGMGGNASYAVIDITKAGIVPVIMRI